MKINKFVSSFSRPKRKLACLCGLLCDAHRHEVGVTPNRKQEKKKNTDGSVGFVSVLPKAPPANQQIGKPELTPGRLGGAEQQAAVGGVGAEPKTSAEEKKLAKVDQLPTVRLQTSVGIVKN